MERKNKFRDPKIKKKVLWMEIAQILHVYGHTDVHMEDILNRKMRSMKRTYKTIKENNKKSTTGRGSISWEYYDIFEEIFAKDRTINHGATLESSINIPSTSCQTESTDPTENENPQNRPILKTIENLCTTLTSDDIFQSISSVKDNFNPSSPESSTSSRASRANSNKSISNKKPTINKLRQKQLAIEEQRVEAINRLKDSLDESNKVQKEQNDLIKQFLFH